jgi:hypothetical protein
MRKEMAKKKEKPKKKTPLLNFNINRFSDYEELTELSETKNKIYKRLVEAIQQSIDKKSEIAEIFKINETDNILLLEKNKWKNSLENAILFYTEAEDYDNCIKCRDIIKKL